MKTRKWTALVAAAVLVASVSSTVFAADSVPGAVYGDQQAVGANKPASKVAEDLAKAGVKDVKADHYAAGSISVLVEAGLMAPDTNGNINPDAQLTAADGVAIFAKVLGIASKTDTPEQALAKAQQAGIARQGLAGATALRRSEVAQLIGKALGITPKAVLGPENYPFADYATTSPEDRGILAALYDLGVFKGYEDKTFRPDGVLTRAEIAILVDRILGAAK
jgi:hypothetical protein